MSRLVDLDLGLRRHLRGKTLLGEIAFEEHHCSQSALLFKGVFSQHGVSDGLLRIRRECPIAFAIWLVNEAFYSYDSNGYWPAVLGKVGLAPQNNSQRFGATFIDVIEQFGLPRFRRLNTHWSYLGPILAHCGVPKSRLSQFFDQVLPLAARIGVGSADGLAEFQQQLPSLRVSRSIEWFIRFGDPVSADFVRRCLDMYRLARTESELPPAAALGVPERVRREFENWTQTAHVHVATPSGPRPLRPRLFLDPSRGVQLRLPAQPCQHASLDWEIRIDSAAPIVRTVPRFAGERHSEPADLLLGAPFSSVMVRLAEPDGHELGAWVLRGLPTDRPVMFFDPQDFSVLPGEVSAGPQGLVVPVGYSVRVRRGHDLVSVPVLSPLGRLPFGWDAFEGAVCDLGGASGLVLADDTGKTCREVELSERDAAVPTLDGEASPHLTAADRTRVFVGAAPRVLIPTSRRTFDEQWMITVDPVKEHANAVLPRIAPGTASLFAESSVGDADRLAVPLDQPRLLGADPWGVFEVLFKGPLGQSARFRIAIVPPVRVEHNWSERSQGREIRTTLHTRADVATATASVPDRVLSISRERTPLRFRCDGYGGVRWSIPVDLQLPIPSWSVHDTTSLTHLASWSSRPTKLTLPESDGHSPQLLLRTATPWGVARAATLQLHHNDRVLFSSPVPLDSRGYASVDLQPFFANARHAGYPRVQMRLDLQLARTVSLDCLTIERHWTVDELRVETHRDQLHASWTERFPMQGRVLRIHSRLTPWESARTLHIDASARDAWVAPVAAAVAEPGQYRVELGIEDQWAGSFTSAASCDWDHGTIEQWRARPLYGEPSVDGCLYHYLVNASDGTVDTNTLYIGTDERGEELSTKLFLALQTIGRERIGPSKRLERLLSRVWLWPLLRGLIASGTSPEPRMLLELGVLAQARSGADRPGLTENQADQLWRLWAPLGAWADLQAILADANPAAEARYVRWLGEGALSQLGPVGGGGRLRILDSDGHIHSRGTLLDVIGGAALSPFDRHGLRQILSLRVLLDGEQQPCEIEAIKNVRADMPARVLAVEAAYPPSPSACCACPEQAVVELVNRGLTGVLKGQEAHCKPFPTSPIGPEAFQDAGFDWAIAAAEQPSRRDGLVRLCIEARDLARDVPRSEEVFSHRTSFERLRSELKARAHPLADQEPLLGLHQASWLVASALIWRSLGRQFVPCPPHRVAQLATTMYDLAPRLFAHDLTKVCAIEALLAAKTTDGARPNEAHE